MPPFPWAKMLFPPFPHCYFCPDPSRSTWNINIKIIVASRNFPEFFNFTLHRTNCPLTSAPEPLMETPWSGYKWVRSQSKLEYTGRNQALEHFLTKTIPNFNISSDLGWKGEKSRLLAILLKIPRVSYKASLSQTSPSTNLSTNISHYRTMT